MSYILTALWRSTEMFMRYAMKYYMGYVLNDKEPAECG
jgi:hypothetical protein